MDTNHRHRRKSPQQWRLDGYPALHRDSEQVCYYLACLSACLSEPSHTFMKDFRETGGCHALSRDTADEILAWIWDFCQKMKFNKNLADRELIPALVACLQVKEY